jgi:MFS transporter, DHA3 family, macrolide efflux protein
VSRPGGTRAFHVLWAGQMVSVLGSELTGFALGVWIYQRTASVTQLSVVMLATLLPGILMAPLAGACVDRMDRRTVMLLGDSASALCTLAISLLWLLDGLRLWNVVALTAVMSGSEAFQSLAYLSLVPQLVPRERLGRANGLLQLGQAVPRVIGPAIAGGLLEILGLGGVLLVDFVTYLVAVTTLLLVRTPGRLRSAATQGIREPLPREIARGWSFLRARPGLQGVLALLAVCHFCMGIINVGGQPLVLSFVSPAALGALLSVAGVGFVLGSLAMSLWGGPKRLIHGVLGFSLLFGCGLALAGLRQSVGLIASALLLLASSTPILLGCAQALWQVKVPLDFQGRVFAVRDTVTRSALLLGYLITGPLADRVFEPRLAPEGAWAGVFGPLLGTGPGRGVALMLVLSGALPILAAVAGWLFPQVRRVEDQLPDTEPVVEEPEPLPAGSA